MLSVLRVFVLLKKVRNQYVYWLQNRFVKRLVVANFVVLQPFLQLNQQPATVRCSPPHWRSQLRLCQPILNTVEW